MLFNYSSCYKPYLSVYLLLPYNRTISCKTSLIFFYKFSFFLINIIMRFQKYLKVNRYKPYKYYYLDYEILRNSITTLRTQEEEDSFKSLLDENLNRVFGFIESKYQEIKRRIKDKKKVGKGRKVGNNKNRKALSKSPPYTNPTLNIPPSHTSITTTPSHNINTELKSFSEFIRINLTGFKKILKRHDKRTEFKIQKVYKPFLKEKIKKLEKIDELFMI
ncbi:Vacuolar transporter chaperone 4 [Nosema bombycis CQ1]|uniref:Vacuolar transporter chaperone 4 n=1 Tax=Nosema bombycis (strain CQ1 / CVCC 102059) TaxID=578461 RepID=R0MIW3_NOSB1|nr:Vacuolar transporter chaperone 4 [Nosema bombycis CQ1]|eukprot:EOB14140.1 Vacuolar transporter chaperone 4 [Nosema bombycis CQ1]